MIQTVQILNFATVEVVRTPALLNPVALMQSVCQGTIEVNVFVQGISQEIQKFPATQVSLDVLHLFLYWMIVRIFFTNTVSFSVVPESEPALAAGCERNEDCPDYAACRQRLCINPCAEDHVCAPTANCKVARHQAVCTCPDGYIGTPEVDCKLRKQSKMTRIM